MLKPQGDTVKVILGPVQLTDIVRSGSFAMDAPLDLDKMIPYIYPDFPQPQDPAKPTNTASLPTPEDHWNRMIVVSHITRTGKWIPATMTRISADGERTRYQPHAAHLGASDPRTRHRARGFRGLRDLGEPPAHEPDQLGENEHGAAAEADHPHGAVRLPHRTAGDRTS